MRVYINGVVDVESLSDLAPLGLEGTIGAFSSLKEDIAMVSGFSWEMLVALNREIEVAVARHVYIYIAHRIQDKTGRETLTPLNRWDPKHGRSKTVINSCERVDNMIYTKDPRIEKYLPLIENHKDLQRHEKSVRLSSS